MFVVDTLITTAIATESVVVIAVIVAVPLINVALLVKHNESMPNLLISIFVLHCF